MIIRKLLVVSIALLLCQPAAAAAQPEQEFLHRVKQEILLPGTDGSLLALQRIETSLQRYLENPAPRELTSARQAFADLVGHWKAVEAVYIAGALDSDYLDHPRYIDHFHQGKVTPQEVVRQALQSDSDLRQAMFKTSARGINALEYLLFAADEESARRWRAALIATGHIEDWLSEIDEFYRQDRNFEADDGASLKILVHALVDSSYRLAAWRVGEPGGLTGKDAERADAEKLEYFHSGLSMAAVEAILETHAAVLELGDESGYFASRGSDKGLDEIAFQRRSIDDALALARELAARPRTDLTSPAYRDLYRQLDTVYRTYYFLLVDALGIEGKIMDADGD